MRLRYLGHACFEVQARDGCRILLDPYRSGALNGRIRHAPIRSEVDIVAVTHYHEDHGWIGGVPGQPLVVDEPCTVSGIRFDMSWAPHDCHGGSHMGLSRQIRFEVDGVSILHTGDLGTLPDEEQLARLRPVDLLLLPVGGTYTIGPSEAVELVQRLRPRWTVPMHFRHPKVDLEMASRDVFVDALPSDTLVNQVPGSDWICQADDPSAVILLEPAL